MRTIRLSTAYQLFLTALLLGACLGIISRQLPTSLSVSGVAQAQSLPSGQQTASDEAGTLICCYNGQFVVVNDLSQLPATAMPTWQAKASPAAFAPALAPVQTTSAFSFTISEQTRFAEQLTPRLFLFVHAGEAGLADYRVRVRKDGQTLTVTPATNAGIPSYTWPTPDSRQRYANLKVEFPTVTPAGLWEIELLDPQGVAVAPPVRFQLAPNDPKLEMYVDYQRS